MAIHVALNHLTRYTYDRPINLSPHVVRLRPAAHCRTPILAYSLKIKPETHFINWQQDPFGNYLARLVFPEKTRELSFEVDLVADMTVINPFDFFIEDYAQAYPFQYDEKVAEELTPYLRVREQGPLLRDWLSKVDRGAKPIIDFLVELNQRLQQEVGYNIRMEPGVQKCDETLSIATGSCRDTAWLLAQILRHLGLASRFVSGYLVQLTADQKSLDGPSGPEADFTDLHAWTEVYLPGAGWVGMDPTSGLFAGEGHIPLACSPDPVSASPVTGAHEPCEVDFYFHNNVSRIHEDPRVTKPYTETQWRAIEALGHKIDADLQAMDVRLTMGGEPTFVSIDDMDSPEWTTAALGEHKRRLAGDLVKRLRRRFGPGGALHYGQGKWYPGEPLPRWNLSCFWRSDGLPLWREEALIANEATQYGYTQEHARQFIEHLSRHLGVGSDYVVPGYEDTAHYLLVEGNLPVNVDPTKANLKDPLERRRLAKLLNRGLEVPTGYVLPLRTHDFGDGQWFSSPWTFKRGHMFLIPGDSPMGLRLPLDALPWVTPKKRDEPKPRSLFEPAEALEGDPWGRVASRYARFRDEPPSPADQRLLEQLPEDAEVWTEVIRTALCVESRDDFLHVFLPPLTHLEHYVDLLASLEATARELQMPVFLEGYEPPKDERLKRLSVSPDPGVIEVNIHPAQNWDEQVTITTGLYEDARQSRLGTEKFMLDGRHTGTGGGNHVTLGGNTPVDSPMLRRPDLLRSLITYWQHHPGLSYLFSGMFIGPTSQAPRVDEARHEALYELEIAFQRMPDGEVPQPWLVDRLLRNLLVDLTGNTHRAEFCIDKLYSPDGPTGRLGLLEMRAFEMPPHERMSLMQVLLIRALVARFWKDPYKKPLVRWGTELHDRFLLPHYIWEDLRDVVQDLNDSGYPFDLSWLDPFFEFRFPHYGHVQVRDLTLELQMAIEPWHVLGEEATGQGTARFVDSSVERLQVKVSGMTDSRHVLTCNGRRMPLKPTGMQGVQVAGVRYRAWQPPSALHPTIPVDSPLVFDVVDTWSGRAVGGCTYNVSHPGGRNFEDFPVNANAAESRRVARYDDFGHTPGPLRPPPEWASMGRFYPEGHPVGPFEPPTEVANGEYPYTLDLRRLRG